MKLSTTKGTITARYVYRLNTSPISELLATSYSEQARDLKLLLPYPPFPPCWVSHNVHFRTSKRPDREAVNPQTVNHLCVSNVDNLTHPRSNTISSIPTRPIPPTRAPSLQLIQMLQPRQHNLLARLLNLPRQEHLVQYRVDLSLTHQPPQCSP